MKYWNGQIINPENFRIPTYNISPFSVQKLREVDAVKKNNADFSFENLDYFGNHEFTINGKQAIFKALSYYNLKENDEVYIVTTSGNKYVSGCVTEEIEKYCKWSRELSSDTKLIFLIHEFGTVYKEIDQLLELKLPIIEDLAMSMFSKDEVGQAGNVGDFTIYSLPKFFPIQFGGVLRYNNRQYKKQATYVNEPFQEDLQKVASFFLNKKEKNISRRKENYQYYSNEFKAMGIDTRLDLSLLETPSVYMFSSDTIDLDGLKIFMQKNGVESGKFYGENTFFLPVHQELEKFDLDFIINLVKYFIIENK